MTRLICKQRLQQVSITHVLYKNKKTLVCLMLNVPVNIFFSHVGTEPPLPGYYQYFFGGRGGGKYVLLKDTTRRPEWGSNPASGATITFFLNLKMVIFTAVKIAVYIALAC